MEDLRVDGVCLGGRDQTLLVVRMRLRFLTGDKAGANPHAVGTQRQGCGQSTAVNNATCRDHWHGCHSLDYGGQERYEPYLAANMAAGFDTLGHDDIHASRGGTTGFLGAPDLEHDHDPGGMTPLHKRRRVRPEERDHRNLFFDANLKLALEAGRGRHGLDQIDAERMLGQRPSFLNLIPDEIGRHPNHPQHPETTSVGHRRHQFGSCDTAHASLDDRVANAQFFGESCGDHGWASKSRTEVFTSLGRNAAQQRSRTRYLTHSGLYGAQRGVTIPESFQTTVIRNNRRRLPLQFRGIARRLGLEYLCESKDLDPFPSDF